MPVSDISKVNCRSRAIKVINEAEVFHSGVYWQIAPKPSQLEDVEEANKPCKSHRTVENRTISNVSYFAMVPASRDRQFERQNGSRLASLVTDLVWLCGFRFTIYRYGKFTVGSSRCLQPAFVPARTFFCIYAILYSTITQFVSSNVSQVVTQSKFQTKT